MTDLSYSPPVLAKCTDRNVRSLEHPQLGGPDIWLGELQKTLSNHICASFDFFVDWSCDPIRVAHELWFKFPVQSQKSLRSIDSEIMLRVLRENRNFVDLAKICNGMDLKARAVLFIDNSDFNDDTDVVFFDYDGDTGEAKFEFSNLKKLKERIKTLSGGPVRIGAKGLMFGTTKLECFLSSTDALWPGDADLVVYSKQEKKISCIFEFKKHTRNAKAKFEDQSVDLYYPSPDGRKYNRLLALAGSFVEPIPIFAVFYCNYEGERSIIIEEIEKRPKGLGVVRRFSVDSLKTPNDVAVELARLITPVP